MRVRPARWLLIPLLILPAGSALAQNLLVNSGFDRDLSGWTLSTHFSTAPTPGAVEASAGWTSSDAGGSGSSGGAAFHALAFPSTAAYVWLSQCVPVSEGVLLSFGARIQTTRQWGVQGQVLASLYSSTDCSGTPLGVSAFAGSLPVGLTETSSAGLWLPATSSLLASPDSRAALLEIGVWAAGNLFYGQVYADVVFDNAFLSTAPVQTTTWLLPSAAWVHGAGGAYWRTKLTLVNPGTTDGAVTLKFLPHDVAAPSHEFTYLVRAGETLTDVETNLEVNFQEGWGSILMTSSSSSVFLQSETSTFLPGGGGSVGQALVAMGAVDFAAASPKTLAPIRENAAFRTNLVLANAVDFPITAHVALFAGDGTPIGTRDVDLPPLGMTQINRVAAALGASTLDLGRIAVSTPTPGGLVAAYASVIDNATNDPRTILPR